MDRLHALTRNPLLSSHPTRTHTRRRCVFPFPRVRQGSGVRGESRTVPDGACTWPLHAATHRTARRPVRSWRAAPAPPVTPLWRQLTHGGRRCHKNKQAHTWRNLEGLVHSTVRAACCSPLKTRLATVVVAARTPAMPHTFARGQKAPTSPQRPGTSSMAMNPMRDGRAQRRKGRTLQALEEFVRLRRSDLLLPSRLLGYLVHARRAVEHARIRPPAARGHTRTPHGQQPQQLSPSVNANTRPPYRSAFQLGRRVQGASSEWTHTPTASPAVHRRRTALRASPHDGKALPSPCLNPDEGVKTKGAHLVL